MDILTRSQEAMARDDQSITRFETTTQAPGGGANVCDERDTTVPLVSSEPTDCPGARCERVSPQDLYTISVTWFLVPYSSRCLLAMTAQLCDLRKTNISFLPFSSTS